MADPRTLTANRQPWMWSIAYDKLFFHDPEHKGVTVAFDLDCLRKQGWKI